MPSAGNDQLKFGVISGTTPHRPLLVIITVIITVLKVTVIVIIVKIAIIVIVVIKSNHSNTRN